jgi:hypothetical protein
MVLDMGNAAWLAASAQSQVQLLRSFVAESSTSPSRELQSMTRTGLIFFVSLAEFFM